MPVFEDVCSGSGQANCSGGDKRQHELYNSRFLLKVERKIKIGKE